jgi:hypothetical protein
MTTLLCQFPAITGWAERCQSVLALDHMHTASRAPQLCKSSRGLRRLAV